ncbi:MAG: tetratricopeptide repeat protein [Bacteroidaceae bacterium]|nr:tetratricopeptide repeat protein [Bacteroidaceae bacterium]
MKRIFFIALLAMSSLMLQAQEAAVPKWGSKAMKSIVEVLTYDKDGNLKSQGTGFYISSDGVALADYALFKDAYSAVVVDVNGEKNDVKWILGADDTYSVVKFKVATAGSSSKKKESPDALPMAESAASEGAMVFMLKYSKEKVKTCATAQISSVKTVADSCLYYTLSYATDDSYLCAPAFNTKGELLGVTQPSMGSNGYVLGIEFANRIGIKAITSKLNALALESIHIPKGLPDNDSESLVYLYMNSNSMENEQYLDLLNLFIETWPDNAEGYVRRASPLIDMHKFEEADQDLQTYLRLSQDKALAHTKIADIINTKLVYQPEPAYEPWTFDVALGHANEAIAAQPAQLEYKMLKGQILMAKKDFRGAIDLYDEILRSPDRSPEIYYVSSLAHEGAGDSISVVIAALDSALAMFPNPMPAEAAQYVLRRGQLYSVAGRYRDAVNDYNQYCFLCNNRVNVSFYYDRAKLEEKARMYQQALDDLTTAIGMSPKVPVLYIEKCALLLKVNELGECVNTAKQLLSFDAQNVDALRIMGYAQTQSGNKAEGKANLQRAAELGDESAKEILKTIE